MRKLSSLALVIGLLGSTLGGGAAMASERGPRTRVATTVVHDHRSDQSDRYDRNDGNDRYARNDGNDGYDRYDRVDVRVDDQPVNRPGRPQIRVPLVPNYAPPVMPVYQMGHVRGFVWVSAEYLWINGQFTYVPGHYERARPGFHWVASSWIQRGHHFVKVGGRWARS